MTNRKPLHLSAEERLKDFLLCVRAAMKSAKADDEASWQKRYRYHWVLRYNGMLDMLGGVALPQNHDAIKQLIVAIDSELEVASSSVLAHLTLEKEIAEAEYRARREMSPE